MRALRAAIFGLALGAVACGGPAPGPLAVRFGASASGLDARVSSIRIVLFAGEQSCDVIELSGPETRSTYQRTLSVSGSGEGVENTINSINPDIYTVAAWGFDLDEDPIQFACEQEPVDIVNGEQAEVQLDLRDYFAP